MLFLLLQLSLIAACVQARCYEASPAHDLPEYDGQNPILQSAFASVQEALALASGSPEYNASSFSVEVTSSKESLFSYHHTARDRNASRPDIPKVNGDALYRIASITKSFTVLGILYQHAAGNLSLDDSIDTYVEELRAKQNGTIPWKDITLRSLASQLSGLPREFAQADAVNELAEPWRFGLPPVSRHGLVDCDEYSPGYSNPCHKDDLIKVVTSRTPLFAPNQKSTYSNIAFELLGLAIENVTGLSYNDYINDAIFKPLDMTKSSLTTPPDKAGVIPHWPHYWDVDEGVQVPTGGIYSSSTDLSKYLRYILTHYNGITHAANWIHPVSPSGSLQSFYGMPWEIFHTNKILINTRRPVKFVTKSGGLPGYFSIILTVPEYDLGITILVAGELSLLGKLREIVTVGVVRAAEAIAIEQLQKNYVGTYTSKDPNSTITLAADHRGLVITNFTSNGTDVFTSGLLDLAGAPRDRPFYVQVIPTLLYQDEKAQAGERWRIIINTERLADTATEIWDDFCMTDIDGAYYGGLPMNEFVLWTDKSGKVQEVELTAFRAKLSRDDTQQYRDQQQDVLEL